MRLRAATGLISLLLALPAAAAGEQEECPRWFPDLRCDREGRYDGFVAPVTMPYLFEDPFIKTSLQFVGAWQELPGNSIFRGGNAGLLAIQIRVAITDRLAFLAVRDGYLIFEPDLDLVEDDDGFMDMSFGFKYALVDRPEEGLIITPSIRYETDFGDHAVYQGNGDGIFIPAVSFGWRLQNFHLLGAIGANLPVHGGRNSSSLFYALHVDYPLGKHFVPFIELTGMNWTRSGNGRNDIRLSGKAGGGRLSLSEAQDALMSGRFEGYDLFNLGSEGVAGNNVVNMAWGARFPVNRHLSFAAAYERPLTSRNDLLKQRVTFISTWEF